ncbi:hypothetical protein ACFWQC_03105 [Nocardioides sp. NPDC058538]|uniref:hypothetical protein n=1 Tax=Nocardioides sp. NPDC058538 TaxID=3346542 RepID=UPI0036590942
MNTDDGYSRDTDRRMPDATTPPEPATLDPLATHRDPSTNQVTTSPARNGIAWVRPSDLPTMLGGHVLGRGLDLKADLVRRASRATSPKALKAPVTRTAIADPEPPSITHIRPSGLSL